MQVLSRNMLLNEEEALFTIARELSLQEEALQSAWTRDDEYETLDALNLMEELLLENRGLSPSADDPPPLDRDTSNSSSSSSSTSTSSSSANALLGQATFSTPNPLALELPQGGESGGSESDRDADPDLIMAVSGKLYWFQRKLKRAIENLAPSADDGGDTTELKQMIALIELNDRLSGTLDKADAVIIPIARLEIVPASPELYATMASMMSMLRRGDRGEVLRAAGQLVKMCAAGGEMRSSTLRDMKAAGALPILLAAVARSSEWPEAEIQISKVISVVVTYEEDFALLHRSAFEILSVLNMLQLKSHARARSRTNSKESVNIGGLAAGDMAVSRARSVGSFAGVAAIDGSPKVTAEGNILTRRTYSSAALLGAGKTATEDAAATDSLRRSRSKSSAGAEIPASEDPTSLASAQWQDPSSAEVRVSVAGALAKLSVVLAKDWSSNKDFRLSMEPSFSGVQAGISDPIGGSLQDSISAPRSNSGGISAPRSNSGGLIGRLSSAAVTTDKRRRSTSGAGTVAAAAADASRTLETILNVMCSACMVDEYILSVPPTASVSPYSSEVNPTSASPAPSLAPPPLPLLYQIDKSLVYFSCTLRNLAEVPQCRQGLVTGNALRLLLLWLDLGAEVLRAEMRRACEARTLCQAEAAGGGGSSSSSRNSNSRSNSLRNMRLALAAELMNNTAAAVMLIVSYSGGDEIMGWIHATVMSEKIPCAILRFIHAGTTDLSAGPGPGKPTDSCIPAPATNYLAHALHQLCRRHFFRAHLLNLGVPTALCNLFVTTATPCHGPENGDGWPVFPGTPRSNDVAPLMPGTSPFASFRKKNAGKEFEPTKIEYKSSVVSACLDGLSFFLEDALTQSHSGSALSTETSAVPPLVLELCSEGVMGAIKSAISCLPRCRTRLSALQVISALTEYSHSVHAVVQFDLTDALVYISSEADELHRPPGGLVEAKGWGKGTSASKDRRGTSASLLSMPPKPAKMERGTSGPARPTAANYDLLHSVHAPSRPASKPTFACSSSSSSSSASNTTTAAAAAWLSTPAINTFHNLMERQQSAPTGLASVADILSLSTSNSGSAPAIVSAGIMPADMALSPEQGSEETLTVCYALANICHASQAYALRVFNNNLAEIMLPLIGSENVDVSRQALRCISAMCVVLASSDQREHVGQGSARQRKAHIHADVLAALAQALQSDNCLVQREAICGIASLAAADEQIKVMNNFCPHSTRSRPLALHSPLKIPLPTQNSSSPPLRTQDAIMEGPLRRVVGLMVDPNSDKELRQAAEQVLVATGFSGGEKDFQMCFYDFQILQDWFTLKRSLKPQALGHRMVRTLPILLLLPPPVASTRTPTNLKNKSSLL